MKISITFDIEPDLHSGEYVGITEGLPKIMKILEKNKIKATFFITGDCINKYPETFRKIRNEGHEIASHGKEHERFDNLASEEKDARIKDVIKIFNKHLGESPRGFRAPQHSIDSN